MDVTLEDPASRQIHLLETLRRAHHSDYAVMASRLLAKGMRLCKACEAAA